MHIVIIAGKNESLYQSLREQYGNVPDITTVGWTDEIVHYMRAADVVCTKPGGVTMTECLTLGKPMIIYKPIPGQELANTEYLLRNHLAIRFAPDLPTDVSSALKKLQPWREQFTAYTTIE